MDGVQKNVYDGREELYRLIAAVSGDTFFEMDPVSGLITWSSDLASNLLGYADGELKIQLPVLTELVHAEDRDRWEEALKKLREFDLAQIEIRLRRKDDDYVWVQIIGLPVEAGEDDAIRIVGVVRSTQDLREAREALYEARRMETIGTMASGIAHEFNNHLTPIRGFIELALDYIGWDHPAAEGLQTALDRVEYCTELVGQIQAYGRKTMIQPEPVDITRLMPTVLRLAISTDPESAARVTVIEDWPHTLPFVTVDKAQFQQAMVHLVKNALEAMPNGGSLTVRMEEAYIGGSKAPVSKSEKGQANFLSIRVIDNGVGIKPENRMRIFEPFFTTRGRAQARGMGLPMVQGMVDQHGGWMEIQTEVGRGTEVRFFLPLDAESQSGPKVEMDEDGTMKVNEAASLGRMLVADDEKYIRRLIRKMFEPEGWQVEEASSNHEVLKRATGEDPGYDLIVLDMTMPGPATEECIRRIHGRNPDTRILVMSGFARDERIEKLLTHGRSEFVGKPFSPKELLSKVDELMAK